MVNKPLNKALFLGGTLGGVGWPVMIRINLDAFGIFACSRLCTHMYVVGSTDKSTVPYLTKCVPCICSSVFVRGCPLWGRLLICSMPQQRKHGRVPAAFRKALTVAHNVRMFPQFRNCKGTAGPTLDALPPLVKHKLRLQQIWEKLSFFDCILVWFAWSEVQLELFWWRLIGVCTKNQVHGVVKGYALRQFSEC